MFNDNAMKGIEELDRSLVEAQKQMLDGKRGKAKQCVRAGVEQTLKEETKYWNE